MWNCEDICEIFNVKRFDGLKMVVQVAKENKGGRATENTKVYILRKSVHDGHVAHIISLQTKNMN